MITIIRTTSITRGIAMTIVVIFVNIITIINIYHTIIIIIIMINIGIIVMTIST